MAWRGVEIDVDLALLLVVFDALAAVANIARCRLLPVRFTRSKSTSSVSAPRSRSAAATGRHREDSLISRVVRQLRLGAAVTTFKNIVDKVVTEHGVAELRGQPIRERTRRLIAIAHPNFREQLERQAREIGYL